MQALPIGKGVVRRDGHTAAILNFGTLLPAALTAAQALGLTVVDMRFIKPLDTQLIEKLAASHELLITLEENSVMGGAGSAVCEHLNSVGISLPILQLGLPDRFIDQGTRSQLLTECGLDAASIEQRIAPRLAQLPQAQTNEQLSPTEVGGSAPATQQVMQQVISETL